MTSTSHFELARNFISSVYSTNRMPSTFVSSSTCVVVQDSCFFCFFVFFSVKDSILCKSGVQLLLAPCRGKRAPKRPDESQSQRAQISDLAWWQDLRRVHPSETTSFFFRLFPTGGRADKASIFIRKAVNRGLSGDSQRLFLEDSMRRHQNLKIGVAYHSWGSTFSSFTALYCYASLDI